MAVKIFAAVCGVFASALFALWTLWRREREVRARYAQRLNDALAANARLSGEVERLRAAAEAVAENRRRADAEVHALRDGDSVGNALDALSK